jgi:hypothetical protein
MHRESGYLPDLINYHQSQNRPVTATLTKVIGTMGAILAAREVFFKNVPACCWAIGRRVLDRRRQWVRMGGVALSQSPEASIVHTTKQISVFLENKPGRLANVLAALANDKVNIIALSVMDKHEHGVLRLVTDDIPKTRQVIQSLNTPFTEADVVVVELRNQPGALSHVCESLAAAHINIDHAYCSSGGRNGRVYGIFKVSNTAKAMRVLGASPNLSARRLQKRVLRDQRSYAPKGNSSRR